MIKSIAMLITHEDGTQHRAEVSSDGFMQWGADTRYLGDAVDLLTVIVADLQTQE